MKKVVFVLASLVIAINITGCHKPQQVKKDYTRQLLPGQQALRKITDPLEIPDFTPACGDLSGLKTAVARSLNYMSKPSSKTFYPSNGITHQQSVDSLKAFADMLDSGLSGPALNAAIRSRFDVYTSVGCDDEETVLFTGYYTPIFDGSLVQTEKFRYPLYKQPADLVKSSTGEIRGRRNASGEITPYPPRATIEDAGLCKGDELVWLGDPFEAYIAHVQGSAKIRLPDGKLIGVGYAANNGFDYKGISQQMIADGVIDKSQLSLTGMIEYFKGHVDQVARYTRLNPRFVFFRQEEGPPRGSLNEPVTVLRTIATDKTIFPRAAVTFITTKLPLHIGGAVSQGYSGFALDQDTGGAIRARGGCDIYIGEGDDAGRVAGQTYHEGRLYYLFIKQ